MKEDILFYSDLPLGFHNAEAEEKMGRFAARGRRVVYVEQLGIRNPRPHHLVRVVRAVGRRNSPGARRPFETLSPKLLPPRRAPLVDALNRRWLARQLAVRVRDPARTIFWLRYPTPELLPFVEREPWRLVVYEAVDEHGLTPGMTPRLRRAFSAAEERLLARAGLAFAWSEPIRERLAQRHGNVRLATAAADLEPLLPLAERAPPENVAAFLGGLGFRFDPDLFEAVARRLPGWTFLVAGPVPAELGPRLGSLANVTLRGRYAPSEVPGLLAEASVGLIPYRRDSFTDTLVPIKLVEYLAAGRAVVSTPLAGIAEFEDVVAFADDAESFADAVREAGRTDSPAARRRRAERARPYSWERRIDEMEAAIEEAARG